MADGTYTGDGNRDLDFGGVNMVVMSEYGPDVTIIDCEGDSLDPHRGFCSHSGEDGASAGEESAGRHQVLWDACDERGRRVASGVYFCRIEAGEFSETRRMVSLR